MLLRVLDWIDRLAVIISVAALIILTVLICVSVTGRYIFNQPIPDDLVFSEFLMVFLVFLPLASVQAAREHVFVTIFTEWTSNRTRVILETFGVYVGLIAFAIVTVAVYTDFEHAVEYGSYVDGPLDLKEWPPKLAVFLGLALFTIRLAVDAVQSVIAIKDGTAVATKSEEERVLEAEL